MEQNKNPIDPELLKQLKIFGEGIKRFGEISNQGFKKLASYGWYVDADISLGYTTGLMEEAINGNQKYIDEYFSEYYRNSMDEKKGLISRKSDSRSKIIEEAFFCHQNKMYYASTTLFLSQADGICSGLLFRTRKNKEALKQYISNNKGGSFFSIIMTAIENTNAIDSLYAEINLYESQLNRHGVMHGWDTDFGNELNSLKAFSLLAFVSDFIDRY